MNLFTNARVVADGVDFPESSQMGELRNPITDQLDAPREQLRIEVQINVADSDNHVIEAPADGNLSDLSMPVVSVTDVVNLPAPLQQQVPLSQIATPASILMADRVLDTLPLPEDVDIVTAGFVSPSVDVMTK